MRTFLFLLTGVLMTQATISKADDLFDQEDDAIVDMDLAETEFVDFQVAQGWNRWTCTSRSTFPVRLFRGSSYYFRPQSGEGQEAKRVALKIAVRNCEFSGGRACTNSLNDCQVTNQ